MSEASQPEKKLKIVSLQPKVVFIEKTKTAIEEPEIIEEEVILAPFLMDEEKVIENISELIDKVYDEFSQACARKNLVWEAELELGMEFGVKFTAKLKIAPKDKD